jgi:hypothetical protein
MADKTIKINKVGTTYNFTDSNGNLVTDETIEDNKKLNVDIGTGFTSGSAQIDSLTLYNVDANGVKVQTPALGSWTRTSANTQPNPAIKISTKNNGITIKDTNHGTAEVDFFFSVAGTDGTAPFASDPELRVKKLSG